MRYKILSKSISADGEVWGFPESYLVDLTEKQSVFHTNNSSIWGYVNKLTKFNRFTNSPLASYKGQLSVNYFQNYFSLSLMSFFII